MLDVDPPSDCPAITIPTYPQREESVLIVAHDEFYTAYTMNVAKMLFKSNVDMERSVVVFIERLTWNGKHEEYDIGSAFI